MHENPNETIPEPEPQLSLDAIAAPPQSSNSPDAPTQLETASNANIKLEIENQGLTQNIEERKKYAHRIYCMISVWLGGVFVILLLAGFNFLSFRVSDSVLLAVIGSTTVNVLGLFYIVTNYLFPKP